LYTYTNICIPRFSPSGFFGPSRCLIPTPGLTSEHPICAVCVADGRGIRSWVSHHRQATRGSSNKTEWSFFICVCRVLSVRSCTCSCQQAMDALFGYLGKYTLNPCLRYSMLGCMFQSMCTIDECDVMCFTERCIFVCDVCLILSYLGCRSRCVCY